MWKANKYYRGDLGEGDLPPDVCIEIALWDRFGWGPDQTDSLSLNKLRMMFIVMEQERVSRHATEKLGAPDSERMRMRQASMATEAGGGNADTYDSPAPSGGNARVLRRQMKDMGG